MREFDKTLDDIKKLYVPLAILEKRENMEEGFDFEELAEEFGQSFMVNI